MSTHSHVPKKTTASIAVIIFLIPLFLFILWLSITIRLGEISERDQIDTFLSYFPAIIRHYSGIIIFSIICCVAAMYLAAKSFRKKLLPLRIAMFLVVIGSIFLIFFNISRLV